MSNQNKYSFPRESALQSLQQFYKCKTPAQLRQQLIFEMLLLIANNLSLSHSDRVRKGIYENQWLLSKEEPVELTPNLN